MRKRSTIIDIAKALGVSVSTVHRALKGDPSTTAATRNRVLQMANKLEYKPNLAARFLSSKQAIRISVNTPKGTTSFWDEVRTGIAEEKDSLDLENLHVEYRTYSRWGEDEFTALEQALHDGVNGVIAFPSDPAKLEPLMRHAERQNVPIVFIATDAPDSGRLAVVSIDTLASGALAADIMARILHGKGKVAVTICAANITEHAEKYRAFQTTMARLYPAVSVLLPLEDRGNDSIAYKECSKLLKQHPDLTGIYVTTEESMPVIKAARDMKKLGGLTIVTTDLFPTLVNEIRSGVVTATIYQRPRTQGRMAFRVMHEYLLESECPQPQITFAPHLVMRGNLEFFLQRTSLDTEADRHTEKSTLKVRKQNLNRRATYSTEGAHK